MAKGAFSGIAKNAKAVASGLKSGLKSRQTFVQRSRSVSPSEKAAFHELTGAGKRHIARPFLGLSPQDETTLLERLDTLLHDKLRATT